MSKTKNIKNIIICSIFLVIIIFSGFFTLTPNYSFAANEGVNETVFNIQVISHSNNKVLAGTETTYNGGKAYLFKQKYLDTGDKAQYFKPMFNFSSVENLPTTDEGKYQLKFYYQYLNGYNNADWGLATPSIATTNTLDHKEDFSNFSFSTTISNWGIYKFHCEVGDKHWETDYFIIEPVTTEITVAPNIKYVTESSVTGMYTYHFSLMNTSTYENIDSNSLKWFVLGTADDGNRYVLENSDLSREEFYGAIPIKGSISRTGNHFYLDVPVTVDNKSISAKWEVWCEYMPYGATETKISNILEVTTGRATSNLPLILGGVGVVVLLGLITTISLIVKAKHEKIY